MPIGSGMPADQLLAIALEFPQLVVQSADLFLAVAFWQVNRDGAHRVSAHYLLFTHDHHAVLRQGIAKQLGRSQRQLLAVDR